MPFKLNPFTGKFDQVTDTVTADSLDVDTGFALEDLVNMYSAGKITGGEIYQGASAGTVRVTAGTCFFKETDDPNGTITYETIPSIDNIVIDDNTTNYIYATYNGGMVIVISSPTDDADGRTSFNLGKVYRNGDTLHIINSTTTLTEQMKNLKARLLAVDDEFVRTSGMILSETGNRYLALTSGVAYSGLDEGTISAQDTSGSDTMSMYYRDGSGGFTEVEDETQLGNSQYDDNSGTLASLTAGYYGVYWIWADFDAGHLLGLYGQGDYAGINDAFDATVPTSLPSQISNFGILVGKIIFLNGATNFNSVQTPFDNIFQKASALDHGGLTGLTDNDHTQYLLIADIDDTPVDSETDAPISSNWAYDHVAAADPHTGYVLESEVDDTPVNGVTTAPISSNWAYDHVAAADPHTGYELESAMSTDVPANETDPIVGAVTGIVKADGGGNISAAVEDTDYQGVLSEGAFADGDKTKLDGIEASADVTDAANVNAVESDPIVGAISGIVKADGGGNISAAVSGTDYAPASEGVTNGDSHDHSGGDGAQIDHTTLSNIGTNAHSVIDTHLASTSNPHSVSLSDLSISSTDAEIDAACDGIGVTIPRQKVVEIGTWDMNVSASGTNEKYVSHGLTHANIVGIKAIIRNDDDTYRWPVMWSDENQSGYSLSMYARSSGPNIRIFIETGGYFDSASFDSTAATRGWLVIDYID